MFPRLWSSPAAAWVVLACALAAGLAVVAFVDLTPRVEGEFFFADDDPQLAASREIRARFDIGEQAIVRVADPRLDEQTAAEDDGDYLERVDALAGALEAVDGVTAVYSVATHDPDGPLYGRILSTPDPHATNVVLQVDDTEPEVLVPRIEAVVDALGGDLDIVLSGAPVIVEWIRRNLLRDLVVFTAAAALVFVLLVGGVYRDLGILVGTLATCALSIEVTLLALRGLGVSIGLLTANLVTIVFVLTLSHLVFLTANWRNAMQPGVSRGAATSRAVRDTFEGSFWSMTTTLLGFLSLWIASARPLRELGTAGAVGTVLALVTAYSVFPVFLARWARGVAPVAGVNATGDPEAGEPQAGEPEVAVPEAGEPEAAMLEAAMPEVAAPQAEELPLGAPSRYPHRHAVLAAAALVALVLGAGVPRLDTDPGLLSYFAPGTPLRDGLERVDRDGGSSPLQLLVRDGEGGRLDTPDAYARMRAYQESLEADPRVGVVLSPAVLIDQARTMPLARLLPLSVLLDIASSPRLDQVALGFVTADRTEGLYTLRMRESVPVISRDSVVADVRRAAVDAGLEPVEVAGLYELQGRLGHLIRESLAVGMGGLLLLFLGIAAIVSRHAGTTARMWICLAAIPLVVLGTFGWLGVAVDIITSPAANVALAMGVDSMIHLVVRARRFRRAGLAAPWDAALDRVRAPVLSATAILGTGFGIFVLSSFPPTRRFGLAVVLGTVTAATLTLVVLPRLVARTAATR